MVKKTRSAGGVVLNKRGEVLVVSQFGNSWSLPKGHIDEGENELAAAKREIYEESGIQRLDLIRELGRYERHKIGKYGGEEKSEWKEIVLFLFTTDQEELTPIDPDNPEARWVAKDQVTELLTHPKDKAYFDSILKEI